MKTNYIWLLIVLLFGFTACENDDVLAYPESPDAPGTPEAGNFTSGTADLSTFVSVGNSLTSGYSDGALFIKGQEVSFPNILAQQFSLAGGGTFSQPLMNDNIGGLLLQGSPVLNPVTGSNVFGPRRIFNAATQTPVTISGSSTTEITNINPGPYNNMGVPGAKSFHIIAPGYGNIANFPAAANPYFIRMASTPNATVVEDAMAQNPTFFSLWIGNNDVLGYGASGGDGSDPITDIPTFTFALNTAVQAMTSGNAEGIISNIPSITAAPYFTTVPYAPLDPTNPAYGPLIPTLNSIYGALNGVYAFLQSQGLTAAAGRDVVFSSTSASPVVIFDESLVDLSAQISGVLQGNPGFPAFLAQFGIPEAAAPIVADLLGQTYGQARQATPNDLIVLTSSPVIGTVNTDVAAALAQQGLSAAVAGQFAVEGVTLPLADKWVLIPSEQDEISAATATFNQIIEDLATQNDLILFDVNTFFDEVATSGFQAGSAFMTADYVTGGTFSLDGIHPSPRGNAVVANQMIDLINAKYGSNLPNVNPVDYTGVYLD